MAYFIMGTKDGETATLGIANDLAQAEEFIQQYTDQGLYQDYVLTCQVALVNEDDNS